MYSPSHGSSVKLQKKIQKKGFRHRLQPTLTPSEDDGNEEFEEDVKDEASLILLVIATFFLQALVLD